MKTLCRGWVSVPLWSARLLIPLGRWWLGLRPTERARRPELVVLAAPATKRPLRPIERLLLLRWQRLGRWRHHLRLLLQLLQLLLLFAKVRVATRLLGRGHYRRLAGGAGRTRRELLLVLVGPVKRLLLVALRLRRLLGGRLSGRHGGRPADGGGLPRLRGWLLLRTGGVGAGRVVGGRRPPLVWVLLIGGAIRLERWIHGSRLVLRAGKLRLIEVGRARVLLLVVVRSLLLRVACNGK